MSALADVDATAVLVAWYKAHPAVLSAFGSADAVSGKVEPPYPHLRVQPGGVELAANEWRSAQDCDLSVYADAQSSPGDSALRDLLVVAIDAALELDDQTYGPGQPVVTYVQPTLGPQPIPEVGGGYARWSATVRLHMHPPSS